MKRLASQWLQHWLRAHDRKPLVLRGARQVGKTWLVRELANAEGLDLVEVNLERNPELGELVAAPDPAVVVRRFEAALGRAIDPKRSLLFFDEVQAFPEILHDLRWFCEEMPELAVVAAGSLLEFALADHDFSMPVGRVSYAFIEPLTFREFLWAEGEEQLEGYLANMRRGDALPDAIHTRALELLRLYSAVGGMPAACNAWHESRSLAAVAQVQRDLLLTYQDDFNKYRKTVPVDALRKTMQSVVRQLGRKFSYAAVDVDARHAQVKRALEFLVLARVCAKATHTAANGVPLGAEEKATFFKCVFLDVGLAMSQLGLAPMTAAELEQCMWAGRGGVAEQIVGQLLRGRAMPADTQLFYWQQMGSGAGEVDYIVQHQGCILPIEVKAGASGSMKSLHAFMQRKGLDLAVRFDANAPSVQHLDLKTNQGLPVEYDLVSLPIYMVEYLEGFLGG